MRRTAAQPDATLSCLDLTSARLRALRRAVPRLHRWYDEQARDLPWRRTRDPYAVWISEAMLQQTQVATVVPYYERWMAALPDVRALAAAGEARVLGLWEGLGYYARARNLHRAARQVVSQHGGRLPSEPTAFGALPGVGPYTAAAVLSIAFDHDLAVVDGNVRRVLSRLVALDADPRRAPQAAALEALAARLLPPGTAARHNQAMMELGARICTPRAARCDVCPLRGPCAARAAGHPEAFPPRPPRRAVPHHDVAVALVFRPAGALERPFAAPPTTPCPCGAHPASCSSLSAPTTACSAACGSSPGESSSRAKASSRRWCGSCARSSVRA